MPTTLTYEDDDLGIRNLNIGVEVHTHQFEDQGIVFHIDIADEAIPESPKSRSIIVSNPPLSRLMIQGGAQVETTQAGLQLITLQPDSHLIAFCLGDHFEKDKTVQAFTVVNSDTNLP